MADVADFYAVAKPPKKERQPCRVAQALQEYEERGDQRGKKALETVLAVEDLNGGQIIKVLRKDNIKAMQGVNAHTPISNHRREKCACYY